jgi:hypothetical protein
MLQNVRIYNAQGFAVTASAVDGFIFDKSAIVNTGLIGLYLGAESGASSNHIQITDSVFSMARTNALVLDGVMGAEQKDNLIAHNFFVRNHFHGLYLDERGKPNNGGQVFLPNIVGATFSDNVISYGYCPICNNMMVWGFELGPKTIQAVRFLNNTLLDTYGVEFFKNSGTKLDSSNTFEKNLSFNSTGIAFNDATNGVNTVGVEGNISVGVFDRRIMSQGSPSFRIDRRVDLENGSLPRNEGTTETYQPFGLSPYPREGAPLTPLVGCTWRGQDKTPQPKVEFVSMSNSCENNTIVKLYGFSFESTYSQTYPFYRCRNGIEHFESWGANCEGSISEGPLGYAKRD